MATDSRFNNVGNMPNKSGLPLWIKPTSRRISAAGIALLKSRTGTMSPRFSHHVDDVILPNNRIM
ncbi:hypothetical protein KCP75_15295 [Salmonella enterica subsp. enterica]|nr:hypothetical protein KCP75_15295 [Salmonella enterica subsp. enterica]